MYAVIETGGKQYRVQEGDVINVEKLNVSAGDKVTFDRVLVLNDGKTALIGAPVVDAAKVEGSVIENGKGEKVIIFKYKSKKDYRKKQGHRQPYTKIQIDGLVLDGKKLKSDKPAAKAEKPAKVEEDAAKPAEEKEAKAEKKPAAKKTAKKAADDKEEKAEKPAAKKSSAKKAADDKEAKAEKKPAAKKTAKKAAEEAPAEAPVEAKAEETAE